MVLFFGLITVTTYGQKKKTSTQKGSEISLFPKLDNLQVEVKNSLGTVIYTNTATSNGPTTDLISNFTITTPIMYLNITYDIRF